MTDSHNPNANINPNPNANADPGHGPSADSPGENSGAAPGRGQGANPGQYPAHSRDENLGRPVVQNPVQPVFGSPATAANKPKRRVPLVPAILAGAALFVVGGLAGGAVGASAVMVADSAGKSQVPGGQNGPGGPGGQNGNGAQPGGQSNGGLIPGG